MMLGIGAQRDLHSVLLIDDDLVSREVLATVLTMGGFSVQTADSGEAALEVLSRGEADIEVILMDARMPTLSGTRLIAELRARSVAVLIAISASNPPDDVREAADGFLKKPFGSQELERFLDRAAPPAKPSRQPTGGVEPALSSEKLALLRGMMPEEAVRRVVDTVVSDLGDRIQRLELAFVARDGGEVRRIGHAIKGGCAMAGAEEAAGVGSRIEIYGVLLESGGGDNHADNGLRLLAQLRDAKARLESMLKTGFPG